MNKNYTLFTAIVLLINSQLTFAKTDPNYPKDFTPKASGGIRFTENKGQVHDQDYKPRPDVLFGGSDGNLVFHLKNNGISYQLSRVDCWKAASRAPLSFEKGRVNAAERKEIDKSTIYRLDINWLNANTNATIVKGKTYEGINNYYLESSPNGALNVQSFENVIYKNIYSGIDLKWYQNNGHLKYDYMVAAGANYKNIQLEFSGATAIKLNSKGELVITTPLGNIIEQAPLVKQNSKTLNAKWVLKTNGEGTRTVTFDIQNINPDQAFVIDPAIRTWGTYYGGSGSIDYGTTCVTDGAGNIYMAGYTDSNTGAVVATVGAHQTVFGGGTLDAFLVKFNSVGVRQWGTYYGGSGNENGNSCAVDPTGNIYLAGYSASNASTVIATVGAHQPAYGGGFYNAFLVKFNNSGVRQWATYYGGTGDDDGRCCSIDPTGNVYLAGRTTSNSGTIIATTGSHQTSYGGTEDAFLVKFNSAGVRQWGTYYGSSGYERGYSCITDVTGNPYLTGYTDANTTTVIATVGAHQTVYGGGGSDDAFLVKFNPSGVRQWGTYYGGLGNEQGRSCATDAAGNIYMAGFTQSTTGTIIATASSHQPTHGGGTEDAFLVKFNSSGVRQWGTYYGGSGVDLGNSCGIDGAGNPYISGSTQSNIGTVIATAGSHQTALASGYDAFLAKFDQLGVRTWGTYYGGLGTDHGNCCASDGAGNLYLGGYTDSNTGTIIATTGSHQSTYGGGTTDAFLVKFIDCSVPANPSGSNQNACANNGSTLTATSGTATINWYATPSSTAVLGTGTAYITPTLSVGTYTYYAEALTCISSATRTAITLTVNPIPTITVNSGTICNGITFTIVPSGANTYTFQGGNSVVSPTATTSYTVTGTSTAGCVGNVATSNITVNALPTINVSTSNTLICVGQPATLNASGANTYTFNPGGSGASIVISPTATTNYTVTGTNGSGCQNSSIITQSVSACTNINNLTMNLQQTTFEIFPNPANGLLNIKLETFINSGQGILDNNKNVLITNSLGQIVLDEKLIAQQSTYDIQHFPSGIYFVKIGNSTKKIIKQ